MWKQLRILPNKQKFKIRDQDSVKGHTDPKREGRAHVWVQEGSRGDWGD